ncbi:voltage-dependent calcium channel subunit alpha-2/delta-3-like [Physella acuta]|uniref:voltage-dependent calcium channel subunit alpha-2/delta-3-like n=1 Tax=Physella acuta TaxID=109671 RepID=UPI0027DC6EF5|nr:voltage-dependent calcium channel subunit alpha-2/delta-3-like [Physella acuta]
MAPLDVRQTRCLLLSALIVCSSLSQGQTANPEKTISRIFNGVESFRSWFVELAKSVTGTGIFTSRQATMTVMTRGPEVITSLLKDVKHKMENMLSKKEKAVLALKKVAEESLRQYGPYSESITFKDVSYYNAKKIVIDTDLKNMENASISAIKETIHYLPTDSSNPWPFQTQKGRQLFNTNFSSIHVPTNIYDKSPQILNGVKWSANMTQQFITNSRADPSLAWQYFCSSDGFFRIYPAMKWPSNVNVIDTYDCRMRKWYIQASSSPKNVLILLDASGSMKGLRFVIATSTVSKILETLSDEDYFNIITFSDEARYVDECFNDTLISANADNIKLLEEKIDNIMPRANANFEKALTKAFQLFLKEEAEFGGQTLCNRAIIIVTDGAPENFEQVFYRFNWPHKLTRVFTFLIGKEVPENRQTKWMACVNKGEFTHISTRADVQENVQKYIKVLSRPLALKKVEHKVWSSVYLDYMTEKNPIKIPISRPHHLDANYDDQSTYEGLGLVMSFSMPVYDVRDKVGELEEVPDRNLIGVVGTDIRINDIIKMLPTFKLGVHGYAFGITNHGYVLFHPDYRPFHSPTPPKGEDLRNQERPLRIRPNYNSIELSEVELTLQDGPGWDKDHPLRRYLLTSKSGGYNMTPASVLSHTNEMRRAKERKNNYLFMEVADTFRLVFALPEGYGSRYIKLDDSSLRSFDQLCKDQAKSKYSKFYFSAWIYCSDGEHYFQMKDICQNISIEALCDQEHMLRLRKDMDIVLEYSKVWEGVQTSHITGNTNRKFMSEYDKCWVNSREDTRSEEKQRCFVTTHRDRYGIKNIWIGTSTGLTSVLSSSQDPLEPFDVELDTIQSFYYQMAVDAWEEGYRFVFTGPVVMSQRPIDINTSYVTIATAELVGLNRSAQVPAAVVAFTMQYSAFYDIFEQQVFSCTNNCQYTCKDTENFLCYLVDHNGYILISSEHDRNGTGMFLGQHNGRLMRALLNDNIFKVIQITDYQSTCEIKVDMKKSSASSSTRNPLQMISRFFFWLISEFVLFLSDWNVLSFLPSVGGDKEQCEKNVDAEDHLAKFLLCNFVIDIDLNERFEGDYVFNQRQCSNSLKRYMLNHQELQARNKSQAFADCVSQCSSKTNQFYEARWMNETNMMFVVMDVSCVSCSNDSAENSSHLLHYSSDDQLFSFDIRPVEIIYILPNYRATDSTIGLQYWTCS